MEKTEMLIVSTGNISESTAFLLGKMTNPLHFGPCSTEEIPQFSWLTIYRKSIYGWFIFLGDWDATNEDCEDCVPIPCDLRALLLLAQREKCDWLCLDCDGEVVAGDGIQSYVW